jgi:hypothetical protein
VVLLARWSGLLSATLCAPEVQVAERLGLTNPNAALNTNAIVQCVGMQSRPVVGRKQRFV